MRKGVPDLTNPLQAREIARVYSPIAHNGKMFLQHPAAASPSALSAEADARVGTPMSCRGRMNRTAGDDAPVVGIGDHAVAVEDAADVLLRPVACGQLLPHQAPRRRVQRRRVALHLSAQEQRQHRPAPPPSSPLNAQVSFPWASRLPLVCGPVERVERTERLNNCCFCTCSSGRENESFRDSRPSSHASCEKPWDTAIWEGLEGGRAG